MVDRHRYGWSRRCPGAGGHHRVGRLVAPGSRAPPRRPQGHAVRYKVDGRHGDGTLGYGLVRAGRISTDDIDDRLRQRQGGDDHGQRHGDGTRSVREPDPSQEAAANQLVAETTATLAKYASLSAATAAGYTPATNPDGYLVHYANWGIAKTDGFDPSSPAFLMYANTVDGPKLLGAMYLGPAPCTPGPDVGGPLTQWHAHDDLCLSDGQVVGKTSASGVCAAGVHNTNTYFMLHVWTEPSLASTHQFQPDLTRAELAPIIRGQA